MMGSEVGADANLVRKKGLCPLGLREGPPEGGSSSDGTRRYRLCSDGTAEG